MPESTYHKDIQLACYSALKWRTFIDAFSEPFLNHDVPKRNLIPDMRRSFYYDGITVLNT